jgi:hypothetical protein
MKLLRMIFCRHKWDQRAWLGSESGFVCVKCGRIKYVKTRF